jgi:cytoskeletal protein CcmA (bactofilin family)
VAAQSKFFSTSSRGGAEGAKQNAQLTTLQSENERMNACTAAGRIYAPTHPNKDVNDCIPHLTLDPTSGAAAFTNGVTVDSGGTTVTGNSIFNNNLTVGGTTAINNSLNVTGTSTFGDNVTVNGRVTAGQLYVGSGNVGSIPTCTSSQKLQWNGTAWTCVTDNIGATADTEVDPKVGTLTNGRWCRTNGTQIHCDVNVPVSCGTSQKLYWNGSAWSCVADQGITSETDPKVGATTSGKWCRGTGSQVTCDQDPPSGSTTTSGGSASCPGTTLYWGSGCGASVPGTAHGGVRNVSHSCDCSKQGSATYSCNNGSWVLGSHSCSWCSCSGGDDDFGDW